MAAPKKPGKVRHLHIDPYVRVKHEELSASFVNDRRIDRFLIWWDGLPSRKRTKMALELLVAACNGELGVASAVALGDENAEKSQQALESLLANMMMDEE